MVYVYGTLRAIARWRPARWDVRIDGEPRAFSGYSVAVANSGVFGGGMRLVPDARLDDGLLDVVLAADVSRARYLAQLPRVFSGAHVGSPGLTFVKAREVTFAADRPFDAYADGDPVAALPATIRVQPGALRVMAPR
jgi:diacylglycerol kinase family enzyme